jgi:hypothetical protein
MHACDSLCFIACIAVFLNDPRLHTLQKRFRSLASLANISINTPARPNAKRRLLVALASVEELSTTPGSNGPRVSRMEVGIKACARQNQRERERERERGREGGRDTQQGVLVGLILILIRNQHTIANFQGWRLQGDSIRSGSDATFFFTTVEFFVEGSISFDYKVYTYGGKEDTGLRFYIDEEQYGVVLKGTRFEYKTVTAQIAKGTHIFKWMFIGGAAGNENQRERGARIRSITILNDYAAYKPTPCPAGTFTSIAGSIACAPVCYETPMSKREG